jgi:hypothetical protein
VADSSSWSRDRQCGRGQLLAREVAIRKHHSPTGGSDRGSQLHCGLGRTADSAGRRAFGLRRGPEAALVRISGQPRLTNARVTRRQPRPQEAIRTPVRSARTGLSACSISHVHQRTRDRTSDTGTLPRAAPAQKATARSYGLARYSIVKLSSSSDLGWRLLDGGTVGDDQRAAKL